MITLTTVGYGDVTPQTMSGRIVIMLAAVMGIIQVSFVINVVNNLFSLNNSEKTAVDKIDRSRIAAKAISKSIKYLKVKKNYYRELEKQMPALNSKFLENLQIWSNHAGSALETKTRSESYIGNLI